MKKLGPTGVKTLKIAHLLFAILWIGGGIALITLLFTTHPTTGEELFVRSRVLQIIDDYMIIPGAIATLLIGFIYGIWTNWGFFKHHWVSVKWVFTIAQILFGALVLGPWVNNNVEMASTLGDAALTNEVFNQNVMMSKLWGSIQVSLLILLVVVSVYKPWRKKRAKQ